MNKTILLLPVLSLLMLGSCGTRKPSTTPDKDNTDQPTNKEDEIKISNLDKKQFFDSLKDDVEAVPETSSYYGINSHYNYSTRSEEETTEGKIVAISNDITKGSVSIGDSKLWYKGEYIYREKAEAYDPKGKLSAKLETISTYQEELYEKLDTNGYGYLKTDGKDEVKNDPEDAEYPNSIDEFSEAYKIEGTDSNYTKYISTDVSSTLEKATKDTLSSFDELATYEELNIEAKLTYNVTKNTKVYEIKMLDDEPIDETTTLYKDDYKITIELKNNLLTKYAHYNRLDITTSEGQKYAELLDNTYEIVDYTEITYPDTTEAQVTTVIDDVTPYAKIFLGFGQLVEE